MMLPRLSPRNFLATVLLSTLLAHPALAGGHEKSEAKPPPASHEKGEAKKPAKGAENNGGVYRPVAALEKPQLILDSSVPKPVEPATPNDKAAGIVASAEPHAPAMLPTRRAYPVAGIDSMRVKPLFEQ